MIFWKVQLIHNLGGQLQDDALLPELRFSPLHVHVHEHAWQSPQHETFLRQPHSFDLHLVPDNIWAPVQLSIRRQKKVLHPPSICCRRSMVRAKEKRSRRLDTCKTEL